MDQEYIDAEWTDASTSGTSTDIMTAGSSPVSAEKAAYEDMVIKIEAELQTIESSFMAVGCYLKKIKDHELYKEDRNAYKNIYEFAEGRLRLSKSTTSRLIKLCEEFSDGQDSPRLAECYAGYSYSQLTEMLPMEPGQRGRITPEMTIAQIREEKSLLREEQVKEALPYSTPQETIRFSDIPEFKTNSERINWLKQVEDWDGGLWYKDENIHAEYYRTLFPDGCVLVAVRYLNFLPGMERTQDQTDVGACDGMLHYHMYYSDWYLLGSPEAEYLKKRHRTFPEAEVQVSEILKYLQKKDRFSEDRKYIEFDTGGQADKNNTYVANSYQKFFLKNGYLPKYFVPYNCRELFDTGPTITTSSGSYSGTGAITIFCMEENIHEIMEDKEAMPEMRDTAVEKLRRLSSPARDSGEKEARMGIGRIRFFVKRPSSQQLLALMGITREQVDCSSLETPSSVIAKAAGNGIEVRTLSAVFGQLDKLMDDIDFHGSES